jgi:serine/threonine protein kinase
MKPLAQNTLIQNRYLIVHLIGKGGMGEVYLAVDQRLGSAVALKRTFFAGDEMLSTAFEREARILARMRHPVLPKVSDHFSEGEEQYLVMEHISGDDLAKRLEAAQKPFPLSWVMFWADQLLDALSYLHSHEPPIIHRDIKPQNLKLTDENHVILLDFGLSKNSTGQTKINDSGSTGSVVGYTPHYAPMEQIRGIGTSPKSDIYSLSATLYQLLTNTVPPDALSRADTMLNGAPDPITSPSELNTEIPAQVSVVLLQGMEVSQERRFPGAREMQKALRKAYAQMQDAMSANTVVMNAEGTSRSDSVPVALPSMENTEVMDFGVNPLHSQPTEISGARGVNPSATNIVSSPQVVDAPEVQSSLPRQADVKTAVFLAGGAALAGSDAVSETPANADFGITEDFRAAPDVIPSESFSPDGTVPNVALDNSDTAEGSSEVANFYTSPYISQDQTAVGFEVPAESGTNGQELASNDAAFIPAPAAVAAKKGSGSKAFAIAGGLLALFVLGIAAVGGGLYYYSNYYATAPEPEATPLPALEPTPEPTIDFASTSDNSNVDSTNSNQADVLTVAPTPEPEPELELEPASTPEQTVTTKQTPQTTGKKSSGTPPTQKATPKPTSTRDRKIILQ